MDRRTFVGVVASGILAAPLFGEAQTRATPRRIGWIGAATSAAATRFVAAFLDGMRELGWIEGENLVVEYRWAEANLERLPELIADLLRLRVDVIVVIGTPAAQAAKRASSEIPIVFGMVGDPVASGIIVSFARPGGNATGWSYNLPEITGKQLALIKEVAPGASRVAVLWNPGSGGDRLGFSQARAAAQALRLGIQSVEIRGSGDLDAALSAVTVGRPDALFVFSDAVAAVNRQRIVAFAGQQRLIAVYQGREFVENGGLISYAPNVEHQWQRAAVYVDKILKGAKPADLPVEQPTKFELVINLKTAKALGLTIPQSLLLRADEVIQ